MAVIILSLLFAAGACADPQQSGPFQTLQDCNEFFKYKDHGNTPAVSPNQRIQEHGHDSKIVIESFDQLQVKNLIPEVSNNVKTECFHPFVSLNETEECYYFSNELLTFSEAQEYCQIIAHGHLSQVSLVMLEHSYEEDQAIMNAVAERDTEYWIGASSNDGVNWNYVDGRAVDLVAPFWDTTEPNTADNRCISTFIRAHGNYKNAYIWDQLCSESLNFICQTQTVCPTDFKQIGEYCYMQSIDIGLPKLTWPMAKDYCQSMAVPLGYHSDLAVLGLKDQDTFQLMSTFATADKGPYIWVGGSVDSNCIYRWTDERIIASSSFSWYVNHPNSCASTHRVSIIYQPAYKQRTWLYDQSETASYNFVCQMLKNV